MQHKDFVVLDGAPYEKVKTALENWISLYQERLDTTYSFEIFELKNNKQLIRINKPLPEFLFYFLVNYLHFPEGINYQVNIRGYCVEQHFKALINKKLMVFISPDCKEFDNVFVTTSDNQTFKVDFGGRITKQDKTTPYSKYEPVELTNSEVIKVKQNTKAQKMKNQAVGFSLSRFKFLWSFALVSLLVLFTTDNQTTERFGAFLAFIIYLWLFADYKMLQNSKQQWYSLIFSFGFMLILSSMGILYVINNRAFYISLMLPFIFLLIQKYMRKAFLAKMKREPVIQRPAPSFADGAYTFLLLIITLLLPVLILNAVFSKVL